MMTSYTQRLAALIFILAFATAHASGETPLRAQFEKIASAIDGRVGVAAQVLESGETASLNADAKYPMQSVYKFPIAMAVLHLVDEGRFTLEETIRIAPSEILRVGHSPIRDTYPKGNVEMTLGELLRYNIGESDGTACDVLLRLAGGTKNTDAYIHSLGVKEISISTTEQVQQSGAWTIQYNNWARPTAIIQLLKILQEGTALSENSRALLIKLMAESIPGAMRIKGGLPSGTTVAHKTGTSATRKGLTAATNDAGIITLPDGRHVALAVFVSDSHASLEARESVIASIARATWEHWTQRQK